MSKRLLKEMFGVSMHRLPAIREMAVEIPDEHLQGVRSAIHNAIQSKQLPDSVLSVFFPEKGSGKVDKTDPAAEPEVTPPAKQQPQKSGKVATATVQKAKGQPPAKPPVVNPAKTSPGKPDVSQPAWDKFKGGAQASVKQASEPKFDPMGTDKDYDMPQFGGAPKSANVDVSTDDDYKSPFNWDKADPHGTRNVEPGDEPPPLKGPGLASRAKQSVKKFFSTDPQKKLDRTMKKMDRDAAPKGGLSRLFRGKDVTPSHKFRQEGRRRK